MTDKLTEALARQQADLLLVAGDLSRVVEGFDAEDKTTWGELLNDKLVCLDAAVRWASFPTDDDVEAAAGALAARFDVYDDVDDALRGDARAALEAVKWEDR